MKGLIKKFNEGFTENNLSKWSFKTASFGLVCLTLAVYLLSRREYGRA